MTDKTLMELDVLNNMLKSYEFYDYEDSERFFLTVCIHNLISVDNDINRSLLDKYFKEPNNSVHCFLMIYNHQEGNWLEKFRQSVKIFNELKAQRLERYLNLGYRDKTNPVYDRLLINMTNELYTEKTNYVLESKLEINVSETRPCPKCNQDCTTTNINGTILWECDCGYIDATTE